MILFMLECCSFSFWIKWRWIILKCLFLKENLFWKDWISQFEFQKSWNISSAQVSFFKHHIHKFDFVHYPSDDNNNFFSIAFKTVPLPQQGCQHSLEHLVFNGSRKYPLNDVFFEIRKRSVNTDLNAATDIDLTWYHFSTTNETDFHQLLDLYLSAVFFPITFWTKLPNGSLQERIFWTRKYSFKTPE
jgi:Zn-dependent M16 (insulinase) family peptidase